MHHHLSFRLQIRHVADMFRSNIVYTETELQPYEDMTYLERKRLPAWLIRHDEIDEVISWCSSHWSHAVFSKWLLAVLLACFSYFGSAHQQTQGQLPYPNQPGLAAQMRSPLRSMLPHLRKHRSIQRNKENALDKAARTLFNIQFVKSLFRFAYQKRPHIHKPQHDGSDCSLQPRLLLWTPWSSGLK